MARRKNPTFLDQLTPKQRLYLTLAVLVVLGVVALVQWLREQPAPAPTPGPTLENRNVRFGMPADAKDDPTFPDAFLIGRPEYVLSYNAAKKIPNWVCWNLTKDDLGKVGRDTSFEPDPLLPRSLYAVKTSDYNGSGFDRGHMCPSADRTSSAEANNVTFYMTNVVPQSPACNQKGWRLLEDRCRTLAKKGSDLYIACGPHGQGGTGLLNKEEVFRLTINDSHPITVPAAVWKVVLILPDKESVPTAETRTLAVWMPNDMTVTSDWRKYVVPVSEVEQRTGYKFFPLVPDEVAAPIKSRAYTEP